MPSLIVIGPSLAVREYDLNGTLTIGRHASNAIQLNEEKASRLHCSVRFERGQAVVVDLNSANGVFVNGIRVASQALNHNDCIAIGETTIVFCEKDSPEKMNKTKLLLESVSSAVNAIIPDKLADELAGKRDVPRPAPVKSTRPARRMLRGGNSAYSTAMTLGLGATVLLAAAYFVTRPQPKQPVVEAPIAKTPDVAASEKSDVPFTPPKREAVRPAQDIAPVKPETPRLSLDEQLKAALAVRDRALDSGNLLGARAALQSFLAAVPADQMNDEPVRRAKDELAATIKIANAVFEMNLKQANSALEAKHFHLVAQRCTNLISNDANGPYGAKARAMLERIDELTAQAAAAAKAKALDAVARGQLAEARAAIQGVLGELAGTRWEGDIETLHLQLIVTAGFLDKLEAARVKKTAAGETISLYWAAKKINGSLAKLNGLQGRIRMSAAMAGATGQAELPFTIKNIETKDFIDMVDALEVYDRFAELACLWAIVGRLEEARAASEAALKKPGNIPMAATLAGLLTNSKNLHLYDFSGWRQQIDWEAVSGSWLTQDGKYVLETADGGETLLKPTAIGGPFPFEKARAAFEFEIRKPEKDWFFTCELGSETQAAILTFNANEAALQDKVGAKSPPIKWTLGPTRVDVSIDGDTVTLVLNGRPGATLTVPGISKQKGTITFQARQCGCTIDNVILRSQE